MSELPSSSGGESEEQLRCLVSAGEARQFMRGIAQEEFLWKEFLKIGWGGHLHRAILRIALMEVDDEAAVDIVPLYVKEYVAEPKAPFKESPEERLRELSSRRILEHVAEIFGSRHEESIDIIEELQSAFSYITRPEIPPYVARDFDDETRDRIYDKYFYARHGLTKERLSPVLYPEYFDRPIPDPNV